MGNPTRKLQVIIGCLCVCTSLSSSSSCICFDLSYVNENNNLHILKTLTRWIISSAVAVYFKEGVATALLPAYNSLLFFLSFLVNHIISCDLDNHLYPM
jgi:hypothetical protein